MAQLLLQRLKESATSPHLHQRSSQRKQWRLDENHAARQLSGVKFYTASKQRCTLYTKQGWRGQPKLLNCMDSTHNQLQSQLSNNNLVLVKKTKHSRIPKLKVAQASCTDQQRLSCVYPITTADVAGFRPPAHEIWA